MGDRAQESGRDRWDPLEENEGNEWGVGEQTQAKTNGKREEKTVDKTRRQTDNKQRGSGRV